MKDVRAILLTYLDMKQHIWNSGFAQHVTNLRDCEPLDTFEAIDRLLFKSLVCDRIGTQFPNSHVLGADALPALIVRPKNDLLDVPLMIEQPSGEGNFYWAPEKVFAAAGIEGEFIEFFQWDRYDFWSASLSRCRLTKFPSDPNLIGRDALIEIVHADFLSEA
jgi:hypothetical protein